MIILKRLTQRVPRLEIGAQINVRPDGSIASRMAYAVPGSVIYIPAYWCAIEPGRGAYNWAVLDANVKAAAGYKIILGLKSTPGWARVSDDVCAPPDEAYRRDYAAFAALCAARYRPSAMEIWNEPDVWPDEIAPEAKIFYGCWGSSVEAGRAYGDLYNRVYWAVKRLVPAVQLLAGGLMRSWKHAPFMTGMSQAIKKYDAISYHAYPENAQEFDLILEGAQSIRSLFGAKTKLWCTETSLLSDVGGVEFELTQAVYFDWLAKNTRGILSGFLWYSLANNGWRNSDMVQGGRKKPAWFKYESALAST